MTKNIIKYFLIYIQLILIIFIGAPLQYLQANTIEQATDNSQHTTDNSSQLLSLISRLTATSDTLSSFAYIYNNIGLRTSLTDLITHNDASIDGGLHEYGYSAINQLTSASHPISETGFNPSETFTYDPVGNRLSDILNPPPAYSYNDANRIEQDAFYVYEFDANGNMIRRTTQGSQLTTLYTYDAENQLIRIDFPDSTWVTYRYDGLGRRFEKNVNGTITRYVYDNEDIILEYNGSNTLIARYTHGIGIDEPLIMARGGNSYFYHSDGLGSITGLSDSAGVITQSYIYNSFGKIVKQTGSIINPYTYTAREFDAESGLYYYRARYYDANIGRFLQEDPVWTQNLYTFVFNSPLVLFDSDGLEGEYYDIRYHQNFWENKARASIAEANQDNWVWQGLKSSLYNGMSHLLDWSGLRTVQDSSEIIGSPCTTIGEKIWAGTKIGLVGLSWYTLGTTQITGKIAGASRTSRLIGLRNRFGKHVLTDPNGFFFAIDNAGHKLHFLRWKW